MGRFNSNWLNRSSYSGRTNWTPAETVCNTAVTVEAFINGESLGSVSKTNVVTDVERGICKWTLPNLPPGLHSAEFRITSGGNGIESTVQMKVAIPVPGKERVVATSCYQNAGGGVAASWQQTLSSITGFTEDNWGSNAGESPIGGTCSPVFRDMGNDMPHIWMHIDDWCYASLTNTANDWGSPESLTDALDDSVTSISNVRSGGYTAVQNPSIGRDGTIANQLWYPHYESAIRRPDVQAFIKKTGAAICRQLGDNDYLNDSNQSWWNVRYRAATSGADLFDDMSTSPGNPFVTNTFDPSDMSDSSIRQMQIEANAVWRTFRACWEMYCGQFNPPLLTETASPPWIVRELEANGGDPSYSASDYVPMAWKLELADTTILSPDYTTCTDLHPIEASNGNSNVSLTNNFISRVNSNTQFNTGGTPRNIEPPTGTQQNTDLRAAMQTASNAGKNIILATPKELGSPGIGNIDGLPYRDVNWVNDFVNTFIPSLSSNVVGLAGDWHWQQAWKTNDYLQVGMSPCSLIGTSSQSDNAGNTLGTTFNMVTPTNYSYLGQAPISYDFANGGYDAERYGYARLFCSSGGIQVEGRDNRKESFLLTHNVNSSISATGGSFTTEGILSTMAVKSFTLYASPVVTEAGPNNAGIYLGYNPTSLTSAWGAGEGFPFELDSNGSAQVFVEGINERFQSATSTPEGNAFELIVDPEKGNATGFAEKDDTTQPTGNALPRSASITLTSTITGGTSFSIADLSTYTKELTGSAPRTSNNNLAYNKAVSAPQIAGGAVSCFKGVAKVSPSANAGEIVLHPTMTSGAGGETNHIDYLEAAVSVGDYVMTWFNLLDSLRFDEITTAYDASDTSTVTSGAAANTVLQCSGYTAGAITNGASAALIVGGDYLKVATATVAGQLQFSGALPQAIRDCADNQQLEIWVPETGLRVLCSSSPSTTSLDFEMIKSPAQRSGTYGIDIQLGETAILIPQVKIVATIDDAAIAASSGGGGAINRGAGMISNAGIIG